MKGYSAQKQPPPSYGGGAPPPTYGAQGPPPVYMPSVPPNVQQMYPPQNTVPPAYSQPVVHQPPQIQMQLAGQPQIVSAPQQIQMHQIQPQTGYPMQQAQALAYTQGIPQGVAVVGMQGAPVHVAQVMVPNDSATYNYGNEPAQITCRHCNTWGLTRVRYTADGGTWCMCLLAACFCPCCMCVPFFTETTQAAHHSCGNCGQQVGFRAST